MGHEVPRNDVYACRQLCHVTNEHVNLTSLFLMTVYDCILLERKT